MLELNSPAKINLFLRVVDRRQDGYHEIASLFQAINLCDKLIIQKATQDCLICSDSTLATDSTNLIWKAIDLFRSKSSIKSFFEIHLDKQIPREAGLGGGSSNAATVLWGVNLLCGRPFSQNQLADWSAEIGSDIPFFFSSGTAYCTGRGEKVLSLSAFPPKQIWVVKPKIGLPTSLVYRNLNLNYLLQRNPLHALEQISKGEDHFFNDLEIAAFQLLPELAALKASLSEKGFTKVLMSGSGSSFFCLGEGKIEESLNIKIYKASYINRHQTEWY